jgi:hypothetical protein
MFTFRNEQFGFYLTDISYDNIAVDADDVAKFIDLEHIIVVDKNPPREGNDKLGKLENDNGTAVNILAMLTFSRYRYR